MLQIDESNVEDEMSVATRDTWRIYDSYLRLRLYYAVGVRDRTAAAAATAGGGQGGRMAHPKGSGALRTVVCAVEGRLLD